MTTSQSSSLSLSTRSLFGEMSIDIDAQYTQYSTFARNVEYTRRSSVKSKHFYKMLLIK